MDKFVITTRGVAYAFVYIVPADSAEEAQERLNLPDNEKVLDVQPLDMLGPSTIPICSIKL